MNRMEDTDIYIKLKSIFNNEIDNEIYIDMLLE